MFYYRAEVKVRLGERLYRINKSSKYFDTAKEALEAARSFLNDAKEDCGANYRGSIVAVFDNNDHPVDLLGVI